jgi:hypothetical protein
VNGGRPVANGARPAAIGRDRLREAVTQVCAGVTEREATGCTENLRRVPSRADDSVMIPPL